MENSGLHGVYGRSAFTHSTSTVSSFESRFKSPLSITSSIDYESSRTSEDSSIGGARRVYHEFLVHKASRPMSNGYPPGARRSFTEPIVPMRLSYGYGHGFGGEWRAQSTLISPPQRMGPSNAMGNGFQNSWWVVGNTLGEGFKKLPEEILLVILGELRNSHLAVGSLSCATCWMRDCCNLGLSCKKWWRAARSVLYEDIQLIGSDSILHTKKKFKMKYGTRLKLLRRTLRSQPDLACYVKSLRVPSIPEAAKAEQDRGEYVDLVASLIMSCPNLERLPGFYISYKHEFSRFVHALSTRPKLIERVWIIDPNSPVQRQRRFTLSEDSHSLHPALAPGPLLPKQCTDFLTCHSNWTHLQTLFLHCNPGGIIDSHLFTDIINSLPSLQNLHVSSFPSAAFNDQTLLSLPPLKSLRLDNLSGVTSNGLSTYAALPRTNTLTSLSLISLRLFSLPVLARLFLHLKSLKSFTLSQSSSPKLPMDVGIFLHPYLASATLEHLHWEVTDPDEDVATEILSKSIDHSGFPRLRRLRAPTDYDGSLQMLCRPMEKIELVTDRNWNSGMQSQSQPSVTPPRKSSFGSINSPFSKSPPRSTSLIKEHDSFIDIGPSRGRSLIQARRQAQSRLDSATLRPQFHIIVWNSEGEFVERFAVGGFAGNIQSKVSYSLKPDMEGSDEALVRIPALLDHARDETAFRDVCTGNWNFDVCDKGKMKDKWWHTERGRWKDVPLEKFFFF